jgi:hypothetical protein
MEGEEVMNDLVGSRISKILFHSPSSSIVVSASELRTISSTVPNGCDRNSKHESHDYEKCEDI